MSKSKKELLLKKIIDLAFMAKALGEKEEDAQIDLIAESILVVFKATGSKTDALLFVKHMEKYLSEAEFIEGKQENISPFIISQTDLSMN